MSDAFTQHILALFGDKGREWLDSIPALVSQYKNQWNFTVLEPYASQYNYVVPVILADNTPAVLKLGCPGNKEFLTEIAALTIFNGQKAVKVLKSDLDTYAVLLEKVIPGEKLLAIQSQDDDKATTIASSVMKALWKPVPMTHSFPTVAEWGKGFARYKKQFGKTNLLPKEQIEKAEKIFFELVASSDTPVLLHGDLHYENILSSERAEWLAIDPKGLIGEPAYETGALLRNPFPQIMSNPNAKNILARRIDQLSSELMLDKQRIWGWGFSQAVLSAIWAAEDGENTHKYLLCASMLASIQTYT